MAAPTRAASLRPWGVLQREAATCTRCRLHTSRTHVVFGDGDPAADLVFLGVAPGRHEDLQGKPFAGAAGNLLDNLLLENGLTRGQIYACSVVKCRPPGDRQPEKDEVDTCSRYLREQLTHIAPRVVVALGEVAASLLLGRNVPLTKVAGYRFDLQGATVIPTFDAAAALRGGPQLLAALRRDVRTAARIVDGRTATARGALDELRSARAAEHAEAGLPSTARHGHDAAARAALPTAADPPRRARRGPSQRAQTDEGAKAR